MIQTTKNKRILDSTKLTKKEVTKKQKKTINQKLETEKVIIRIKDKIKKR